MALKQENSPTEPKPPLDAAGQLQEDSEAMLCAYLEGDLDADGQARIEKKLTANPQYRALLAELSGARQMLRSLPREAAPPELVDTLQGHLERSALLDDQPQPSDAPLRINRWPQMMAIAAIIFLTMGLGLVIYSILPGHQEQNISRVALLPDSNSIPLLIDDKAEPLPTTGNGAVALNDDWNSILSERTDIASRPTSQPSEVVILDNRRHVALDDVRLQRESLERAALKSDGATSKIEPGMAADGSAGDLAAKTFNTAQQLQPNRAGAGFTDAANDKKVPAAGGGADASLPLLAANPAVQKAIDDVVSSPCWLVLDTSAVDQVSDQVLQYLKDNNIGYQRVENLAAVQLAGLGTAMDQTANTLAIADGVKDRDNRASAQIAGNGNRTLDDEESKRSQKSDLVQGRETSRARSLPAGDEKSPNAAALPGAASSGQVAIDLSGEKSRVPATAPLRTRYFIAHMDSPQAFELARHVRQLGNSRAAAVDNVAVLSDNESGTMNRSQLAQGTRNILTQKARESEAEPSQLQAAHTPVQESTGKQLPPPQAGVSQLTASEGLHKSATAPMTPPISTDDLLGSPATMPALGTPETVARRMTQQKDLSQTPATDGPMNVVIAVFDRSDAHGYTNLPATTTGADKDSGLPALNSPK